MVGLALIIVGVLFLLKNLGLIAAINVDIIWPILLILIGIGMMSRRSWRHSMWCKHEDKA